MDTTNPAGGLPTAQPEDRVQELGLTLPPAAAPVAAYVPVVVTGSLAFVSGQVPLSEGKPIWTGKLGDDIDLETGRLAAKQACLQGLAALRNEIGSLNAVTRVVRTGVFVASAAGFTNQPQVANGASEVLELIFGDRGRHARAAVGVAELPLGVPVEVELLVEIST